MVAESPVGRVREAVKAVFDVLEGYQAGDGNIADGLAAVIAVSDNPGRDLADIAACAISIVQDLLQQMAGCPELLALETSTLRMRLAVKVLELANEEAARNAPE